MTKEESRSLVSAPEYDFLHTDPHLGSRIMFLTLGGSHAYGTNVEGSDVDVRGGYIHATARSCSASAILSNS